MPPRLAFQCLRTSTNCASSRYFLALPSTITRDVSTASQKRRRHDPYAIAQAQAKKVANRSRQEVLRKERAESLGDPVRGVTTPFIRSFDTAISTGSDPSTVSQGLKKETQHANFLLSEEEMEAALERAKWLHDPNAADPLWNGAALNVEINTTESSGMGEITSIPEATTETLAASSKRALEFSNAEEAVRRIAALSLGSGKDRQRANNSRAIEVFGRHNTDATLHSLNQDAATTSSSNYMPRAGPDTGSSEVQIAILTAKIRTLADFLESRGKKDKINKRNLRLLVHRRQKLLQYLRRKERGGPRWQHVIEKLGLTEGTWKGEISL